MVRHGLGQFVPLSFIHFTFQKYISQELCDKHTLFEYDKQDTVCEPFVQAASAHLKLKTSALFISRMFYIYKLYTPKAYTVTMYSQIKLIDC